MRLPNLSWIEWSSFSSMAYALCPVSAPPPHARSERCCPAPCGSRRPSSPPTSSRPSYALPPPSFLGFVSPPPARPRSRTHSVTSSRRAVRANPPVSSIVALSGGVAPPNRSAQVQDPGLTCRSKGVPIPGDLDVRRALQIISRLLRVKLVKVFVRWPLSVLKILYFLPLR